MGTVYGWYHVTVHEGQGHVIEGQNMQECTLSWIMSMKSTKYTFNISKILWYICTYEGQGHKGLYQNM